MRATTTDSPRIYVASLTDYNAGRLHGVWITLDEDSDEDTISEAVRAMLAKSPEAKAFPLGGPAEEWAIHDYEGFHGYRVYEWDSWDRVARIARMLAQYGAAFGAFLANDSSSADDDDVEDAFTDAYCGEWDSIKAYAEEYVEQCGLEGIEASQLEAIWSYIDFDFVAHELLMGEYWTAQSDSGAYVFRSY